MSPRFKGFLLLAAGLACFLLAAVFLLAYTNYKGAASDTAAHAELMKQRLEWLAFAALPLIIAGRLVWRRGRRALDPNWKPRKSFQGQSFRLTSAKQPPAQSTPSRPDLD